ncbi:glycosyltransferase, partial [Streptomyces sp. NEAU-H3]|nr:glycosyltransferase [Streptomyces sp. NEAU-H3]
MKSAQVPAARPVPPDLTLAVIAKEPLPGRVKTRLCPPCTPAQAAGLARAALHDTLATLAALPA